MNAESARTASRLWPHAFLLIALASAYAFFQDIIRPDWPAFILAPSLVLGFRAAVAFSPQESFTRAALYQSAMLVVPAMAIGSLLDPIFAADWPEWAIAAALVLGGWALLFWVADLETD